MKISIIHILIVFLELLTLFAFVSYLYDHQCSFIIIYLAVHLSQHDSKFTRLQRESLTLPNGELSPRCTSVGHPGLFSVGLC